MSVNVEISSILARYAGNRTELTAEGKTVGDCLRDLARQYPEFGRTILDSQGNLAQSFDVYVNGETTYPHTMTHPVADGAKLNIVLIIHGG